MKTRQTLLPLPAFSTVSLLSLSAWAGHSSLHPDNPRYFLFRGEPAILITSAEHYGAVLNLDFDYKPSFEERAAHGLNSTRTFTGAYVEPKGAFNLARNTLAPAEQPRPENQAGDVKLRSA
jgi:hypothetical protein